MSTRDSAEAQKRYFAQQSVRSLRGARTHGRKLQVLMETISPSVFPIVVELGSGTGLHAQALSRKGFRVIATDLSHEMVYQVRRRAGAADSLICDAASIPLRDECADMVFCVATLHHIEDPSLAIKEAHRVLRRGGVIGIAEPNPLNPWIFFSTFVRWNTEAQRLRLTHWMISKYLSLAGFVLIRETSIIFLPSGPRGLERILDNIERCFESLPLLQRLGAQNVVKAIKGSADRDSDCLTHSSARGERARKTQKSSI